MKSWQLVIGGCSGSRAPIMSRPVHGHLTTSFGLFNRQTKEGFIIDNGTGVMAVVNTFNRWAIDRIHILQTHIHHDHIDGLHLNRLVYDGRQILSFIFPRNNNRYPHPTQLFDTIFDSSFWPIEPRFLLYSNLDLPVVIPTELSREAMNVSLNSTTKVRAISINHPGGALAFRIETLDGAIVFASDIELRESLPQFLDFIEGSRVIIIDTQYTQEEYEGRVALGGVVADRFGWGHSTPQQVRDLLARCDKPPSKIILTHHDPNRDDYELDNFGRLAKKIIGSSAVMAKPALSL